MPDPSIYRPFSKLVRIRVLDCWLEVPENNILLRCFQYVAPRIPYGPWCWNGDCGNDRIRYREPGSVQDRSGLSCQVLAREGLEILELSPELSRSLAAALAEARRAESSPGAEPAPACATEGR